MGLIGGWFGKDISKVPREKQVCLLGNQHVVVLDLQKAVKQIFFVAVLKKLAILFLLVRKLSTGLHFLFESFKEVQFKPIKT